MSLLRRSKPPDRIDPGQLVWIFGTGRTGSTWLAAIMGEIEDHSVWFEPRVGKFFDPGMLEHQGGLDFICHRRYEEVWLGSIRNFVLDGAEARFPEVARRAGYLVIKEPVGSVGAPLLMEALPQSRMVLLVRDPRDVVASSLDASSEDGWQTAHRRRGRDQTAAGKSRRRAQPDERAAGTPRAVADPDAFVRRRAKAFLAQVGNAKLAYDAHEGRKFLLRYEELRVDTLPTMQRLYAALELPVDENALARAVEKHAWENIPGEEKGQGKFYRKASPGGWRDDLSPAHAETVERITAPLLEELYPDS